MIQKMIHKEIETFYAKYLDSKIICKKESHKRN